MTTPATGILFIEPRAKPLSTTGAVQPGCYYQFYSTGTTTPANVYADGLLQTILSQTPGTGGTTAASDGRMVPIYLNPAICYRVQLYSSVGVLLEDTDPVNPATLVTGFGTPTGPAVVTNFPGASATLLQTSQTVAEILAILIQKGIIGA